jgi:acetyl-CoA synthetase
MSTIGHDQPYERVYSQFRWNIPDYYNIGVDICDRHVASRGDVTAVLFEDESGATRKYTFAEISEASNRFANALAARGLGREDRIAILLPQIPEIGIAHAGIYKLGAIAVPLSNLFGPDAIEYRLHDSGARAVITDAVGREKLAEVRERLPQLELVYLVDGDAAPGEIDFQEELQRAIPRFTAVQTHANDPALIIYTSGTTGPPKGVLHAHRALAGHFPGFELSHSFFPQPGDLFWTPADWAWAGGLLDALLPAWHYGYPVLAYKFAHKFDPERAFWLMDKHHVRNTFVPPTALKIMRQVPDPRGRYRVRLRTIMSAGESLGADTLAWGTEQLGITIDEMFGQTEANYIVGNCHELAAVKPGSMGRAYPGHRVSVVDEGGHVVPAGTVGEVAVHRDTPVMFLEYWNKPDATRQKFGGDWMLTGDLAVQDEDGYLFFQGRRDDIIGSAGYRIGPTEVEECLLKHPAVALAGVVGTPDTLRGSVVKAYVQLAPGFSASEALKVDIQTHVRKRLAAYEYPRAIEFIDQIPLTTTGKIKRNELRQRAEQPVEGGTP